MSDYWQEGLVFVYIHSTTIPVLITFIFFTTQRIFRPISSYKIIMPKNWGTIYRGSSNPLKGTQNQSTPAEKGQQTEKEVLQWVGLISRCQCQCCRFEIFKHSPSLVSIHTILILFAKKSSLFVCILIQHYYSKWLIGFKALLYFINEINGYVMKR